MRSVEMQLRNLIVQRRRSACRAVGLFGGSRTLPFDERKGGRMQRLDAFEDVVAARKENAGEGGSQ